MKKTPELSGYAYKIFVVYNIIDTSGIIDIQNI